MAGELDTSKFIWDILTFGGKLDVSNVNVDVLPRGATKTDFNDWQGPVSYPESFDVESWVFHTGLADLTFTPRWEYNGQYIANFNVVVEGSVAKLTNVSVKVETFDGSFDKSGVAKMEYHIIVDFDNIAAGLKSATYKAVARGDGGGMSLA
jgi:hypothetical protein